MFRRPKLSGIGFGFSFSFLFGFLFLFLALVLLPFVLFAHLQMEHTPTHILTHTLILAPIHTLAKTHIKCVLRFWLAGNTFFSESSLGNILEKRSKKKSVFFTCVIWLSASLRPLHSYVFCHPFRKVTLYLLKRRKRYRALYKGTLEMPCWRSFYLTIAQLKLKDGRACIRAVDIRSLNSLRR